MTNIFKRIFSTRSKPNDRIYNTEINDEEINLNISKIILKLHDEIKVFEMHLETATIDQKENYLQELYGEIITIQQSVKEISHDVEKIIALEIECKDFFIIKDDSFLLDKRSQLSQVAESINEFLNIVQQRPSLEALRSELLEKLIASLNNISRSINSIIKDDNNLRVIYKKLTEI